MFLNNAQWKIALLKVKIFGGQPSRFDSATKS